MTLLDILIAGIVVYVLTNIVTVLIIFFGGISDDCDFIETMTFLTPYVTFKRLYGNTNLNIVGCILHALFYIILFPMVQVVVLIGHIIWVVFMWGD